jgi:hypothetical protein
MANGRLEALNDFYFSFCPTTKIKNNIPDFRFNSDRGRKTRALPMPRNFRFTVPGSRRHGSLNYQLHSNAFLFNSAYFLQISLSGSEYLSMIKCEHREP